MWPRIRLFFVHFTYFIHVQFAYKIRYSTVLRDFRFAEMGVTSPKTMLKIIN
jgi:hypothetical protein